MVCQKEFHDSVKLGAVSLQVASKNRTASLQVRHVRLMVRRGFTRCDCRLQDGLDILSQESKQTGGREAATLVRLLLRFPCKGDVEVTRRLTKIAVK